MVLSVLFLPLFAIGQDSVYRFKKEILEEVLGFSIDTMKNPELFTEVAEWLNTAYCYGGKTRAGIDCSDFCSVIFARVYRVSIPPGSETLCREMEPVKKDALQEGDLVFFKIKGNRVSHSGIYLTCNKFAHATVNAGVIVSDLDEPYYKQRFYRGGRCLKPEAQKN